VSLAETAADDAVDSPEWMQLCKATVQLTDAEGHEVWKQQVCVAAQRCG
jgi:hypothetical protein